MNFRQSVDMQCAPVQLIQHHAFFVFAETINRYTGMTDEEEVCIPSIVFVQINILFRFHSENLEICPQNVNPSLTSTLLWGFAENNRYYC